MGQMTRDELRNQRVEAAFLDEQDRSLGLAARLLLAVLGLVFVWIHVENGVPAAFYFYPYLLVLAALLLVPYALARRGYRAAWIQFAVPALWILVLVLAVLSSNPLDELEFPIQYRLGFGNQMYLFLLIAGAAFTYSPRVVLWTGFAAAATWGGASLWVYARPDTLHDSALVAGQGADAPFAVLLDPHYVNLGRCLREIIIILVVSWVIAAFVWRARALVYRTARIERERANLSRYFSANMVDELAASDTPLEETRAQDIAVLFADIVGFTRMTSDLPPRQVIELLREFHARTAAAVFAHGGTLDKFIGDGVMATFGTPRRADDDATRALRCAAAILTSVDEWNRARRRRGLGEIRVGIGVHYGPVVAGDIGGPQRFEFAVVGDTVNVASRLERLTREYDTPLVVSDATVLQAHREGPAAHALLAGFRRIDEAEIRGHRHRLAVWIPAEPPRTD